MEGVENENKKITRLSQMYLGHCIALPLCIKGPGLAREKEDANLLHTACNAPLTILHPLSTPLSPIFPLLIP
jgi:hypothetical protein